jgi:uncharacterized SAM-binding protein YcdF (DUF218 family)
MSLPRTKEDVDARIRGHDGASPMFFILSKILNFFALPSDDAVALVALGVILLFTRFKRAGRALATLGLILLLVAGFTPLGNALILPLEQRFPPWDASHGPPTGIVVLGGAISPEVSAARGMPALNDSAERITATAALARQYPQARIIFSGGNARLVLKGGNEADYAVDLFASLGVPRSRIEAEARARNTIENAEFSKALANPKPGERWLLVTSAFHMPRAMGVFRHVGFDVEPYPVDWRTRGPIDLALPMESVTDGLSRTDMATHEWVGLFAYWITGRTTALFPAP